MISKLQAFVIGALAAIGLPYAWAQTATIFSSIRVNNASDLRGPIVSGGGGAVEVDDDFRVSGSVRFDSLTGLLQGAGAGGVSAISNSSTVGQTLRVTGASAYGWGALDLADSDAVTGVLPSANVGPAGSTTEVQYNNAGALGSSSAFTYNGNGQLRQAVPSGGVSQCINDGSNYYGFRIGAGGEFNITGLTSSCLTTTTPGTIRLNAASGVQYYDGVSAGALDMTPRRGSGNVTFSGCTTTPDLNYSYSRMGDLVNLTLYGGSGVSCTSNNTDLTSSALPAEIRPISVPQILCYVGGGKDNGTAVNVAAAINTNGTISFYQQNSSTAANSACFATSWTASGGKQLNTGGSAPIVLRYSIYP